MKRPALMGIVNLTPDSFSGDGQLGGDALAHARALVDAGADILDIGAESTRPGAVALSAEEEWARLGPFLTVLVAQPWRSRVRLSIDTRHAATAAQVLALGVEMINDVGGLRDPAMLELLAAQACDCIVMHALTIPADAALVLPDTDVVAAMLAWQQEVMMRAKAAGISEERLIFDPGIGFGKTPVQSLELVMQAAMLVAAGGHWLIGHSRKSFLNVITSLPVQERDALTLGFSAVLAQAGVPYLRVHDVTGHQAMFARLCT